MRLEYVDMYRISAYDQFIMFVCENGTIVEFDKLTHTLHSTGEAIPLDELPSKEDKLWCRVACYLDESIVL